MKVTCDGCDQWFHKSCALITKKQFSYLQNENFQWFCSYCWDERKSCSPVFKRHKFTFASLNDKNRQLQWLNAMINEITSEKFPNDCSKQLELQVYTLLEDLQNAAIVRPTSPYIEAQRRKAQPEKKEFARRSQRVRKVPF